MNRRELIELAKDLGIRSEELDDEVYDATDCIASRVNNQGIEEQIDFLVGTYDSKDVENLMKAIHYNKGRKLDA